MAPHGARASTGTVRIKFTCIEETLQCLPEHMSILGPLTQLWAHEHTDASTEINPVRRSALSPWMTWHLMGPGHPRAQWGSFTCIEETLQCLPEHMSILRPLTEIWTHEHTEAIDRTMSTWAYWCHWQNYEHMSILRPLTELWAFEDTEAIDRTMSIWAYRDHWQNYEHMSILRPSTELWAHERIEAIDKIKSS